LWPSLEDDITKRYAISSAGDEIWEKWFGPTNNASTRENDIGNGALMGELRKEHELTWRLLGQTPDRPHQ
jgi:hypothetical protein